MQQPGATSHAEDGTSAVCDLIFWTFYYLAIFFYYTIPQYFSSSIHSKCTQYTLNNPNIPLL